MHFSVYCRLASKLWQSISAKGRKKNCIGNQVKPHSWSWQVDYKYAQPLWQVYRNSAALEEAAVEASITETNNYVDKFLSSFGSLLLTLKMLSSLLYPTKCTQKFLSFVKHMCVAVCIHHI